MIHLKEYIKAIQVALLITGSAILLISCNKSTPVEHQDMEKLITQQSDTLLMINYEDGVKTYRFNTPLMENYEMANEPYMEFRRGIEIETYKDSTGVMESTLKADYAIFWKNTKLWEAKGNVVAVNAEGMLVETQQLFWNQRTKKVYSNVDTKLTQEGVPVTGVGFESNEDFSDFAFRRPRGKILVDVGATVSDSLPGDSIQTSTPVPQNRNNDTGPKLIRASDYHKLKEKEKVAKTK